MVLRQKVFCDYHETLNAAKAYNKQEYTERFKISKLS